MIEIFYTPIKGNVTNCLVIKKDGKQIGTPFYGQEACLMLDVFRGNSKIHVVVYIDGKEQL